MIRNISYSGIVCYYQYNQYYKQMNCSRFWIYGLVMLFVVASSANYPCLDYNQTSSSCNRCQFGYQLVNSEDDKLVCQAVSSNVLASFYFQNQTYECSPGCIKCNNKQECELCLSGYRLVSKQVQTQNGAITEKYCSRCSENCVLCTENACEKCITGFYQADQKCTKCRVTLCIQCNQNICLKCVPGYYADNDQCLKCSYGCLQCTNSAKCVRCQVGFVLGADNTCIECSPKCTTCSSQNPTLCGDCSPGFFLKSSINSVKVCQKCPYNCVQCSSDTTCISCKEGYQLNSGLCYLRCRYPCSECELNICTSCYSGFELNAENKICEPATDACNIYQTQTDNCLSCRRWLGLKNVKETNNDGAQNNGVQNNGTYNETYDNQTYDNQTYDNQTQKNGTYDKNVNQCVSCSPNCVRCIFNSQSIQVCQQCNYGYFLSQSENRTCQPCSDLCHQCNSLNYCLTCKSGNYLVLDHSGHSTGICMPCESSPENSLCASCSGIKGEICHSCKHLMMLIGNKCLSRLVLKIIMHLDCTFSQFSSKLQTIKNQLVADLSSEIILDKSSINLISIKNGSTIALLYINLLSSEKTISLTKIYNLLDKKYRLNSQIAGLKLLSPLKMSNVKIHDNMQEAQEHHRLNPWYKYSVSQNISVGAIVVFIAMVSLIVIFALVACCQKCRKTNKDIYDLATSQKDVDAIATESADDFKAY